MRAIHFLAVGALIALALPVRATNPALKDAQDLGAVESTRPISVTVWLNLQDRAGLDRRIEGQQQGAPFLSDADFQASHAPRSSQVAAVSQVLQSYGLSVIGVGPSNLYVTAVGPASQVGSAFQVSVHDYALRGLTVHAAAQKPVVPASIAPFVTAVTGLGGHVMRPTLSRPVDPETGLPFPPTVTSNPDGLVFSAQCFRPPEVHKFSGTDASGSPLAATYAGNRYGADITNTSPGTIPPCGYKPSDLQKAYNLNQLYSGGWDGTGTTVAIVDAYGSKYIQNDVAAFSDYMGLPPADLTVVGTPTEPVFPSDPNSGWADETTLDVEWVHAIAPGAKIVLFVAPSAEDSDLFAAIALAETYPNVVAISNSWSTQESTTDVPSRAAADGVLAVGVVKGISIHFSSGDFGNETINLGYADVNHPASSPYATGIGGVSTALTPSGRLAFQTSWGTNLTRIVNTVASGGAPYDPPVNLGFFFGGGGGASNVYPKPSFQRALPGARRLVPDISWTADPYTGVEIVETVDSAGDQGFAAIGGTSLSCPMFSGLWAIAAQRAGGRIGQAARSIYGLPDGAIADVTPIDSPFNVAGYTTDAANGTLFYNSFELASPLQNVSSFYSAFYNGTSTRWYVITFGADTSLDVARGYDLATGLGTPNPPAFVEAYGHGRGY